MIDGLMAFISFNCCAPCWAQPMFQCIVCDGNHREITVISRGELNKTLYIPVKADGDVRVIIGRTLVNNKEGQ